MEQKKKKGLSMMKALLLIALIPTIGAVVVLAVIAYTSMKSSLEEEIFHELLISSKGLAKYYEWDIVNSEDHVPTYEHDYVDGFADEDVELTLFLKDVRYISSIKENGDPSRRIEGTAANADIWATVSAGNEFIDHGVLINDEEYYVAYSPFVDETGKVVGMAFAGKQESIVLGEISKATNKLVISTIVILILCTLVVVLVARNIKEPLAIIDKNLQLLSEGELQPYKTAKSSITEIDSIIQSRKKLSATLQEIVQKVQSASGDLLRNGNELQNVATNTSVNAEDISHAVEEMSKGAVSMASDIEHATEKVVDMGGKIEMIVGGINELDDVASGMDSAGQKAMEIIKALDESNTKTAEAIQLVAQNVEATDHSVADISTAINLITAIADQTNLLSLNASIEAARAGEAGRGFAVVANEISSLADQSSESAKQIEDILAVLVADSRRSIEKMEEVKALLKEQQENLKNTQREFANVSAGIQDTRNHSGMVDGQAKDCDVSRVSVVDIISSLSAISEQNAASTEETTASIEELTATINLVAQQATEVQARAQMLEEAMQFFKL